MSAIAAQPTYREAAKSGALAGLIGSVIQALIGFVIDKALLPPQHDNNIAPRFVARLFQKRGGPVHPVRDWSLGTLFHLGYGVGWGCAFGLARQRWGIPSPLLGGATALLIYVLAFSRIGAGTRTQTERHPDGRDWRKQLSLVAVVWTFAMSTAAAYDNLAKRACARSRGLQGSVGEA